MKIRDAVAAMSGYAPGEQPLHPEAWIKLNTNENPYPPSPRCEAVLKNLDTARLRLYPSPCAEPLRKLIGSKFEIDPEQVLVGNGSDDVLNLIIRLFCGSDAELAVVTPSYSLYPTLAQIQEAPCRHIALNTDFSLPADLSAQIRGAKLLIIPSPNAPTGLPFPRTAIRTVCAAFDGAVVVDEAYADFADENAVELLSEFPNLMVTRTFSKSYSLAGLRAGFVLARRNVIDELMKIKDSYNVGLLPQLVAAAAFEDEAYMRKTVSLIRQERERLAHGLAALGFECVPSSANFIFAAPPDRNGQGCYEALKSRKILVRYFKGSVTGRYVRITIGTPEQMTVLLDVLKELYNGGVR